MKPCSKPPVKVVDSITELTALDAGCIAVIGPSATLQTWPASPAAQHLREAARSLSQRLGAPVSPA